MALNGCRIVVAGLKLYLGKKRRPVNISGECVWVAYGWLMSGLSR